MIKHIGITMDTLEVAVLTGKQHQHILRDVRRIIKNLKAAKEDACGFSSDSYKDKRGKWQSRYGLSKTAALTLVSGYDDVLRHRVVQRVEHLEKELMRIASSQTNDQWIEARRQGKQARLEQTSVIKQFVEYATAQGSASAQMYYMNITKMENKALFILDQKYPNIREVLDYRQVGVISTADQIVEKALQDGMDKKMDYKQVYLLAKDRIHEFARVIGKSIIPEQARLAA